MAEVDWGAIANAAVSLYASNQQSRAAKNAGNQAAAGSAQDAALQKYIYDDQRALNMPGYMAQQSALAQYMAAMGLGNYAQGLSSTTSPQSQLTAEEWYLRQNPDVKDHPGYGRDPRAHYEKYGRAEGRQWGVPQQQGVPSMGAVPTQQQVLQNWQASDPGYQFRLSEGLKSTQASAAARGGLNSGATLKALMNYGQNTANQSYGDYLNRLASAAGINQTNYASQIGSAGQNYANQAGQAFQNGANARAQSTYASANAWANGLDNAAYFGGKAYDSWRGGR